MFLNLPGGDVIVGQSGGTGRVGVNTSTPGVPLDVAGGTNVTLPAVTFFTEGSLNLGQQVAGGASNITIRAANQILASIFIATSDERIKNIQGRSDSAADLRKLLGIEITDFLYKDVVEKGSRPQKKVIAQQVENVFPQAVSTSTDVVPDIYKKAPIKDGWVELATDLKVGDRVRLITETGHRAVHEVFEVEDGKFRTDFTEDAGQVFVYGREVKDFRSVDYEAIAMLNVSATQQIKKEKDAEVKALRDENAALRSKVEAQEKRLAGLEAKDNAREARLARLEAAGNERPARAVRASLDLKASNK